MHDDLVLILVPVLKKDRVQFKDTISLGARQQELDNSVAVLLSCEFNGIRSMVSIRFNGKAAALGRQEILMAILLQNHCTVKGLDVFFLHVEVNGGLPREELCPFYQIKSDLDGKSSIGVV